MTALLFWFLILPPVKSNDFVYLLLLFDILLFNGLRSVAWLVRKLVFGAFGASLFYVPTVALSFGW